ncbi:tyrosine-type recombinase/integrase [Actinoplanes subglobosus]
MVRHLDPAEAMFAAMLTGWDRQQASRMLAASTRKQRTDAVRRFAQFVGSYPWQWTPVDVEEWTTELRGGRAHSTIRGYQNDVALFCSFITDARYGWADRCEQDFGTHPVQIFHEWDTARHTSDHEARPEVRPFTRDELQEFFDFADEQVDQARRLNRKGWLAAFRDATLFKVTYAWGLRRREVAMLDVIDFTRNAAAPQFGRYGMCNVRYGKAVKGSPPRRRNVLTTMGWAVDVLTEYVEDIRGLYVPGKRTALWPTERGGRISVVSINKRFAEYRNAVGLPPELHPHCLRHSYVTHLIEDGFDPFFVQQQVGHAWGSTTALYTGVSSDFKNTMLRRALGPALGKEGHG